MVEFDLPTTAGAFVALIAVGVAGLYFSPTGMTTSTILTMVLPSMILFGLVCLAIGVKYGEFRATAGGAREGL